ncbi:MAG: enoyl-CoA hydratase-related protein [Myxococcota bacterium]|nr:enoyl-CoA hydratase-related protein [Myxococcota bacterium]
MTDLSSLETVTVAVEEGVAIVAINRPKALNAINSQVLDDLEVAFDVLAEQDVACVVLTGAGEKSFVAGADIAQMADMSPEKAQAFSKKGHDIFKKIEDFPAPVLGAVNGFALGGGCELALTCDIIYASSKAKFGQPEVKLGLIPGFGGAVRLPRKVGLAAASEWVLTGNIYSAAQAKEIGLVLSVHEPDELMAHVKKVAATIAARAPVAVKRAKKVMVEGLDMRHDEAAALEQSSFGHLFATDDMREGTKAFLEKREPEFKGS